VADRVPEPEADLVRACAEGDRAAWVRFVDRYGSLVAALARRMLRHRTGRAGDADVDEVCGAVFLALLQGDRRLLRRYRPEFRVSTYLGVITRTEVGRWLRAPAGRARSLDTGDRGASLEDTRAEEPSAALERGERADALHALRDALAELPPRDRLLLTLRYVDGLDYGQIAEALRVHKESVGPWLSRAKQRLARRVPHLNSWL
jgi:RNA polymerase sigma-70 factor (ECF subfamily)